MDHQSIYVKDLGQNSAIKMNIFNLKSSFLNQMGTTTHKSSNTASKLPYAQGLHMAPKTINLSEIKR